MIGGGGVQGQKTCHAYFVELIAVVSTFFMECQNSTQFRRYDRFNFRGLDLYICVVNFSQNWANFNKKCLILQKSDLFKITCCNITWATVKLESWDLASICIKKYKKFKRSGILNFWLFQFYWTFSDLFKKKEKEKIQNFASCEFFVLFFCIHLPNFRTLASL